MLQLDCIWKFSQLSYYNEANFNFIELNDDPNEVFFQSSPHCHIISSDRRYVTELLDNGN
jgi:hypothetical protein